MCQRNISVMPQATLHVHEWATISSDPVAKDRSYTVVEDEIGAL